MFLHDGLEVRMRLSLAMRSPDEENDQRMGMEVRIGETKIRLTSRGHMIPIYRSLK